MAPHELGVGCGAEDASWLTCFRLSSPWMIKECALKHTRSRRSQHLFAHASMCRAHGDDAETPATLAPSWTKSSQVRRASSLSFSSVPGRWSTLEIALSSASARRSHHLPDPKHDAALRGWRVLCAFVAAAHHGTDTGASTGVWAACPAAGACTAARTARPQSATDRAAEAVETRGRARVTWQKPGRTWRDMGHG